MGKIVLLVPREDMLYQAHNILQEKKYKIDEMRVVGTESAVVEARQAIAGGASIIIARGLQAVMIKQYTDVPVVDIAMTAQEMGLLVTRARQILKKEKPVIGVTGFKNMFCDMSHFDELYGIELHTYFARQESELKHVISQAIRDGVDLIIGGDTAISMAAEAGLPSLFLSITEESLRQAFSIAERMDFAMNSEKKSAAQMETLFDYSYNGVMRLDSEGIITGVNTLMEDMLGQKQQNLSGKSILEIAPRLGEDDLRRVLTEGEEFSTFLEGAGEQIFIVMAPVVYDGKTDGAIITGHKVRKKPALSAEERQRVSRGLPLLVHFDDILQHSKIMKECVRLAKLYALSEQPVVLWGESGTEKRMLAESIHNAGARSSGPFLDVPCEGLSGEEQRTMIFGERGAAVQAQGGTLLIRDAQELTAANQYRLYQLIRFKVCHNMDIAQLRKVDARVMVTVPASLTELLRGGRISEDLYYLLSGLELSVPPLRKRREDLQVKLDEVMKECCERYSRYHVLTAGAREILLQYPWKGNLFQIESFCDRLVLTAGRRSLDEIAVRTLLEELYPEPPGEEKETAGEDSFSRLLKTEFGGNEDALRIARTLVKYAGNREKTAAELGISKPTLWRRMKKYGITGV